MGNTEGYDKWSIESKLSLDIVTTEGSRTDKLPQLTLPYQMPETAV